MKLTVKSKSIGIIGNGMVGSTLHSWFKNALVFDVNPERSKNTWKEINEKCLYIFICVPTPFNSQKKKFDLSLVEDAIKKIDGEKIIIIKSTILPGTTDFLQKKYPKHSFLFNPEFLTEKTAKYDFENPDTQIIGYTKKTKKFASEIIKVLPKAPHELITSAKNAEAIKYFNNCFFATKVVFANQFYDFCKKEGIEYEVVKETVKHNHMIAPSHLEIFHQGGRGAGGKCLPKDLAAFAKMSNLPLLKKVEEINTTYLSSSKKK